MMACAEIDRGSGARAGGGGGRGGGGGGGGRRRGGRRKKKNSGKGEDLRARLVHIRLPCLWGAGNSLRETHLSEGGGALHRERAGSP